MYNPIIHHNTIHSNWRKNTTCNTMHDIKILDDTIIFLQNTSRHYDIIHLFELFLKFQAGNKILTYSETCLCNTLKTFNKTSVIKDSTG